MNELIKSKSDTAPTAVILSVTQEVHWSEYTDQTITRALLDNRFAVDFSSVNSLGNYPFLNETCAFVTDTETNESRSEVIGPAGMDVHDFLEKAGYTVTYGLDNSEESGSLEP